MPRPRSPNRDKALQLWLDSGRKRQLKDIAAELQVSEEQIRKWKNQDKWDKVTLPNAKGNVTNHKGAPVGNQNAVGHGAPKQNKNAEKYGFFSKYLPEETVSIIQEMPTDPLDILWDQVQIAYAAIIRAQSIMYVRDQKDVTITKIGHKDGETVTEERWEVQQAWDKQGNFLQAQARAQKTLEGLIKQYDELLHKNWELASEEQKARIAQMRAQTDKLTGNNQELEDMDGIEGDIYGSS
jgi:phage terminase small subunit|nr:MAG TPA: terminase small subunit [Caudoviricetes sp.]